MISEFHSALLLKFSTYLFLWGPILTFFKVIGRNRRLSFPLPPFRLRKKNFAILGCGQFSFSNILPRLYLRYGSIFRYAYDPDLLAHRSLCRMFSISGSINSYETIINDPLVRLVYIASPHSTHARYAIDTLSSGKDVYVEKPIAISLEQLSSLKNAQKSTGCKLYVGFNRPHSPFIKDIRRHYDKTSPFFCSMVVFGHKIAKDHWYRESAQGSRIAGNCSHWIDLAVHMLSWRSLVWPLSVTLTQLPSEFSDENFVLHISSPCGSLISLSFFAQHEPHLGVTETIAFHSSSLTAVIDNFQRMRIDTGSTVINRKFLFKNAGHSAAIRAPFANNSDFCLSRMHESFVSTEFTIFLSNMISNRTSSGYFSPNLF